MTRSKLGIALLPFGVLCISTGCISNPLPDEFRTQSKFVSDAELRSCMSVKGTFEYGGTLMEGDLKHLEPTAGDLFFYAQIRREWQPATVRVSIRRVGSNRLHLTFLILSDDVDGGLISARSADGWCVNGKVRLTEELVGGGDGTYVASWLVQELLLDENSDLLVMYAYSSRMWFSGTDSRRATVRFTLREQE